MPDLLPLLLVRPSDVAPLAFVCGDPARARRMAAYLNEPRQVGSNREYQTFTGMVDGHPVTVSSHGVGAGGASICFEELIQAGARTLVRLGTCGSLHPQYRETALIVATAAIRRDGASERLVPLAYPAAADWRVTAALADAAAAEPDLSWGIGTVLSEGTFYPGTLPSEMEIWATHGALAVEMETAMLFTVAGLRGARAGALLCVDNYVFERKTYEPHREIVMQGIERMIRVGLRAVPGLAGG
jgi:uridine phosphorylase